jgi:hypothetical protein
MTSETDTGTGTEDETVVVDASDTTVEEAPEAVAEASPTIIVETADTSGSEAEVERAVETAVAVNELQHAVADIAEQQAVTAAVAADAQFTAEAAIQQTNEVVEEMVLPVAEAVAEDAEETFDLEPDTPPESAGRHWVFRSLDEWRARWKR